ncbi:MAG: cell wall metabolism sensor histidine kinase WalK [Planctomycetes bacterium]|nr:cell wall metabolism sensor histidine kinase WalK [Planctomycetota bacterium]
MKGMLRQFRSFWDAEEIPRRIGLLFVGVYAIAMGGLLVLAHERTSAAVAEHAKQTYGESVAFLATELKPQPPQIDRLTLSRMNRFAQAYRCVTVRLYDSANKVIASTTPGEVGFPLVGIGASAITIPTEVEAVILSEPDKDGGALVVRAPLHCAGSAEAWYVEARFSRDAITATSAPFHMLLVALLCTGAFLLLYGYLRKHFRSMKRIAKHLEVCQKPEDVMVSSMRLDHAPDAFAEGWNCLIDRASAHEEELSRCSASSELLAALNRSDTGELAEAMRLVPLGVLLVSEDCAVGYANAMSCRLMGWSVDDESTWRLESDVELSDDAVQIADHVRSCVSQGDQLRATDHQIEAADGSFYALRVTPTQTAQHARRTVVLIQDVSQQVRADKAREEFVSQVTHELRTPLTNIRAYAETLSSGMFDDPKVITECYNVITKETRRLSRLIEDILSISQLEVGTMQLVMDRVDVRDLLTESVRDVRGLAESKSIDLQLALPAKAEPVSGDRDKLAVVMNNLLGNALKYTPENGQVVVSCRSGDEGLTVSVRDSGIGIEARDHGRIFEKFQRAEDPDVLQETGTGIGLTTAREIVRQHGGDIVLVSKKGEGSTFSFTLEAKHEAAAMSASAPV